MPKAPEDPKEGKTETPAPASASQGGFQAWVPLLVSIVLMPALAYGLTMYLLIPKLRQELGGPQNIQAREADAGAKRPATEKASSKDNGKPKNKITISKVVVNVSGSLGTRLLLASFTLAGSASDFKNQVEDHMDQLRDLAASTLGSKTIADLEKPEARNLIRAELLSQFNAALGANLIQEIYLTEFAIQ